jgi:hypothetical protein
VQGRSRTRKQHLTVRLSLVVLAIAHRRSRLLLFVLCDASNSIMVCGLSLACASDDRGRLGRPGHRNRDQDIETEL